MKKPDKKTNHNYTTEFTFELYDRERNGQPVTNSILESYGQVGISNERDQIKKGRK
ncbi:hypothetical protein [Thermoactinomyces sp. CICC 10523]|jgi:hypothetical protein|uniref:hypothetical protein n=1 Tax=Thermoactinomyces sp. CICC 10523 TaxID=2767428 RepID=UPI0018DB9A71|nr:hypothetical protein [Thermoactinomyces sp. CICC 10523]MBH8597278.1 hypothetical protein [Thermoactinomyces sp. CICC 10523]